MAYTDLTSTFVFNRKLTYQDYAKLAANDAYLKTNFALYRRPTLKKTISGANTWVEAEPNGNDSTTTTIMFPDGDLRSVQESRSPFLSGTTKYVAALFGNTAVRSGGGTMGGNGFSLGIGIPIAVNSWVCVYAVKTTDDATKFILVLANVAPIRANFATLNTALGTNGWLYLGTVRYGENSNNTSKLLAMMQSGNMTIFLDQYAAVNVTARIVGFVIATASGGTSVTYTTSRGMTNVLIPNHFSHLLLASLSDAAANRVLTVRDSGSARQYGGGWPGTNGHAMMHLVPASEGLKILTSGAIDQEIAVCGWIDGALGVGVNPLL